MLVNLHELFKIAKEENIAFGQFNVTNYENISATLETAKKLGVPAMIAFAQTHEENDVAYLEEWGPIMVMAAKQADFPVCVHLDHGVDLQYIKRALEMGFTSVMFDGSTLSLEDNIARTKEVVELAKEYGATVEGEIGKMAGITMDVDGKTENRKSDRSMYTDPQEAKMFVEQSGVDCLACSFGTVHGEYKAEPNLDFELIEEIRDAIGVPIVMHGGSGVSEEDFRKCIQRGVRKINYFTYMDKAGGQGIKDAMGSTDYYHDFVKAGKEAMKKDIEAAMRVFCDK